MTERNPAATADARDPSSDPHASAASAASSASATTQPSPTAADAAVALVTQVGQTVAALRLVQRTRLLTLMAVTVAVFAFLGCVVSGVMLTVWAGEPLVERHFSPPIAVFVEANQSATVLGHVACSLVMLLAIGWYVWLHARFRRRLALLPIEANQRPRVHSGWFVTPIVAFVLAGVVGGLILGLALPEKPRKAMLVDPGEGPARELTVEPDSLPARDPLERLPTEMQESKAARAIPEYVETEREREAWMLHTFWIPLIVGALLLALLPAVYTVQRSRDALQKRVTAPSRSDGAT